TGDAREIVPAHDPPAVRIRLDLVGDAVQLMFTRKSEPHQLLDALVAAPGNQAAQLARNAFIGGRNNGLCTAERKCEQADAVAVDVVARVQGMYGRADGRNRG